MKYTRLYNDETGESHFENCELSFESIVFAPPAPPLELAVFGKAEECSFIQGKPGWYGDWHPAPFRQLHCYLSGEIEAKASDGEVRHFKTGDVILVEDTKGIGHKSHVIGNDNVIIAVIKILAL